MKWLRQGAGRAGIQPENFSAWNGLPFGPAKTTALTAREAVLEFNKTDMWHTSPCFIVEQEGRLQLRRS